MILYPPVQVAITKVGEDVPRFAPIAEPDTHDHADTVRAKGVPPGLVSASPPNMAGQATLVS